MNRIWYYSLPVIAIIVFVALMSGGEYLKKPLSTDDNVIGYIDSITNDIKYNQWEEARQHSKQLESAWRTVVKRIQFSVERDEVNQFEANLARLKGLLDAEEKGSAFAELSEAQLHWEGLGK